MPSSVSDPDELARQRYRHHEAASAHQTCGGAANSTMTPTCNGWTRFDDSREILLTNWFVAGYRPKYRQRTSALTLFPVKGTGVLEDEVKGNYGLRRKSYEL